MRRLVLALPLLSFMAFAEEADHGVIPERAFEIRDCFVRVHYHLKKDEEEATPESFFEDSAVRSLIDEKQSWEVAGIALGASPLVLVTDFGPEERYLDRVEVEFPDGSILAATNAGILLRTPLAVIAPATPPADWRGLTFVEPGDLSRDSKLMAVMMLDDGDQRHVLFPSLTPAVPFRGKGYLWRIGGIGKSALASPWEESAAQNYTSPLVILNSEGEALGCAAHGRVDPEEKEARWIGTGLLGENLLTQRQLQDLFRNIEDWSNEVIHEVKIVYRLSGEESDSSYYSFFSMYDSSSRGNAREFITYGLAVSATQIFVPQFLSWEEAEKIESIAVTVNEEEREGTLQGAYKDFGAFLVNVSGEPLGASASFEPEHTLAPVVPFLTVTVEHKFGGRRTRVRHNRYLDRSKCYRDIYRPDPERDIPLGSIVLDLEGNLAGAQLYQRKEAEEQEGTSQWPTNFRSYAALGGDAALFSAEELNRALREAEDYFDPNIVQKTKEEAKRRPWLGVEFARVGKDLAKIWECEKATKDGKRGLVISCVYPGSPAERVGLKVQDILLTIQDVEHDYPIDLKAPPDHDYYDFDFAFGEDEDVHSEAPLGFKWEEPPPWRPRKNYLTDLLENIGEGKKVKLTYWSDGEEHETSFTVEQAPPDFESARKYKDDTIGLTVKDITYEVRTSLRLEEGQSGAVVAKIEPGSPAAVAKVEPYEIIHQIDGQPVNGSETFEESIRQAKENGKETVTLLLLNLGTSRFANLQLKPEPESSELDIPGDPSQE